MIYGEISSLTHPLYVRARKLKANSFRAFRAGILSDSREQSFETKGAAEPSSQSDEGAGIVLPPKLEAAIEAYRAVKNNQTLRRGRSAKAALMAWLEENSPNLSNQAREEIAKVANGSPEGGAPKTPER